MVLIAVAKSWSMREHVNSQFSWKWNVSRVNPRLDWINSVCNHNKTDISRLVVAKRWGKEGDHKGMCRWCQLNLGE